MVELQLIDLSLGEKLKNQLFRREWFRGELEALVPELFRDLRERRNLTQAELASEAGMKQSAVSRFESSTDAVWKMETLLSLADALDAKLSVTLEPAENVIGKYLIERPPGPAPPQSILEAARSNDKYATGTSGNLAASPVRSKYLSLNEDNTYGTDFRRDDKSGPSLLGASDGRSSGRTESHGSAR